MRARPLFGGPPFLANGPIRLGSPSKFLGAQWGTPTTTSTAVPAGTKCYDCGIQGIRAMTPTMAAMNAACREVANSVCEGAGGTGVEGGAETIVQPPTSGTQQAPSSGTQTPPSQPASPCPPGADDLVCAVYKAQALYRQVYEGQLVAWGTSPQAHGIAADMAHAMVADSFEHPTLKANWDTYSWWIGDSGIKPEEWPELTKNFEQFQKVWNAVPWPQGAELKDLFIRCARGRELTRGYSSADARFYVNRYSGFWPKTDEEIRRTIALMGLQKMMEIYACMEHKITAKIRNTERQAKKWQVISLAAGMVFTGNFVASTVFAAATTMQQFDSAMDFSKFMMGYAEFVEACATAEAEDFTCTYLAPFVLWAMETLFMNEFYDWVAIEMGLPGAREGLTQEEVVKPMVEEMKASGVEVPKAAYTPGGVAPKANPLLIAGGVGVVGVLAFLVAGAFKK